MPLTVSAAMSPKVRRRGGRAARDRHTPWRSPQHRSDGAAAVRAHVATLDVFPCDPSEVSAVDFELSPQAQRLHEQLLEFMDEHVYPAEPVHRQQIEESGDPHFDPPIMEELK